jgi:hypothetical protein
MKKLHKNIILTIVTVMCTAIITMKYVLTEIKDIFTPINNVYIEDRLTQISIYKNIATLMCFFVLSSISIVLLYKVISGKNLKPSDVGLKANIKLTLFVIIGSQLLSLFIFYFSKNLLILYPSLSLVSYLVIPIMLLLGIRFELEIASEDKKIEEEQKRMDEYESNRQPYEQFRLDLTKAIAGNQKVNVLVRKFEYDGGVEIIPEFSTKKIYGHRGIEHKGQQWNGDKFNCKTFDDIVRISENGLPTLVFQYLGKGMSYAHNDIVRLKKEHPHIYIFIFQSSSYFESKFEMQKELIETGVTGIYLNLLRMNEWERKEYCRQKKFNVFKEIKSVIK